MFSTDIVHFDGNCFRKRDKEEDSMTYRMIDFDTDLKGPVSNDGPG